MLRRRQSQGLAELARQSELARKRELASAWEEAGDRTVYAVGERFHGPAVTTISSLHERDLYGWVEQRCAALRARDSSRLDWQALQEEIAGLGRQDFRELVSRLGVLLGHLLTWELQPERRSRRWFLSLREQRQAPDPATGSDRRGDWGDLGR